MKTKYGFTLGDRVMPSEKSGYASLKGRLGTVAGFSRDLPCVGVLWDGTKAKSYEHISFLRLAPPEPPAPPPAIEELPPPKSDSYFETWWRPLPPIPS